MGLVGGLAAVGVTAGGFLFLDSPEPVPVVAGSGRGIASPTLSAPPAAAPSKAPPSKHTDKAAADYFTKRWGGSDKAAKRLKDIRTVGGFLRIYTDLPETANNSAQAITLCERGLEYLKEAGVADPVVFVQAEFGENGNPVLANVLGPSDKDCRVTHPDTD